MLNLDWFPDGSTQEWGAAGARQRGQGGPAVLSVTLSTFDVTCDRPTDLHQWPCQDELKVPTIMYAVYLFC